MTIHRDTTDGIRVLTFDRPDTAANLFDFATLDELDQEIALIEDDPGIRGVVLISAKPKIFIAGADLKTLGDSSDFSKLEAFIERGQNVFDRLSKIRPKTVAAIHGACVGGGYEVALACDFRIATDDKATNIGLPEINLGILPAWGGSTRLPQLIGLQGALDIILAGKVVPAKRALKLGMIDAIAPHEYLLEAAKKEAGKPKSTTARSAPLNPVLGAAIAPIARSKVMEKTQGHYPAPLAALEVVRRSGSESGNEASLRREREAVLELARTETCRNLIRLFFLTERAKKLSLSDFPGLAEPAEAAAVKSVAVIGAGVMGAGIAQWLSTRGMRVILKDIAPDRVAAGMQRIEKLLAQGVKRHVLTKLEARDAMDRIQPAATDVPLDAVDLVIETAVEKMELKKKLFADLASRTKCVLATNTSALSLAEIAAATGCPERVVGIHFFNPVHSMKLVEVIGAPSTGGHAIATALKFVQRIGKLPLLVKDSPGFVVNRILLPYLVEAGLLFDRGAAIKDIDASMTGFGMPMGPLRLIDEVGVDIAEDVAATLAAAFPDHFQVPTILLRMLEKKWLGKKSGRGFYDYGAGDPAPNTAADALRSGDDAGNIAPRDLRRRMVALMVNEAARCVEERIVASADDVDFGMVMGTGFAPFRGGPLQFARTLGPQKIIEELERLEASGGGRFHPSEYLRTLS